MCHITKMTRVWQAVVDLSKLYVCICSLRISGFAGFTVLHLSNPAICICRQVISTLLLEQRWISPKTSLAFSKSNLLQISNKHCSCISQSEIIFSHVRVVMDQNQIDVRTNGQRSKDIESELVKGKSPYPPNKSANNVRLQSEERVNKCNQCGYVSSNARNMRKRLKRRTGEKFDKCNQCK